MPTVKEVHFFDTDEFFASRDVDYSRYHARFNPTARKRLLGEATPIYMYWEPAPQRIQRYNPAMKLILLLRNPVTRAYSHWNHERARGRLNLPFEQAISTEEKRHDEALPLQTKWFSYIDRRFLQPANSSNLARLPRRADTDPQKRRITARAADYALAHYRLPQRCALFQGRAANCKRVAL
jgi:hypothetical protein